VSQATLRQALLSDAAQNYHLCGAVLSRYSAISSRLSLERGLSYADLMKPKMAAPSELPLRRRSPAHIHRSRLTHATFVNVVRYTGYDAPVRCAGRTRYRLTTTAPHIPITARALIF
jgi:hypothetical protein